MPGFLPNWTTDIAVRSVKDFGAVGNGSADDTTAIQTAIDSCFGSSASPHGTSAHLNKALFFPNGQYIISSPLVLTQVRGARIYGAGQQCTKIQSSGGVVRTNGMDYCCFEHISFIANTGAGANIAAFEMDWNGIGSVGLNGNIFTNCGFGPSGGGAVDYCVRIGLSGHGGANNQFYSCDIAGAAVAGLVTWSASAMGNSVQGGGASGNGIGYWIKAGQISSICDSGLSQNQTNDVLMDSDGPLLLKGCRTEGKGAGGLTSTVFNSATGVVVMDGYSVTGGVGDVCRPKGKVILDSCTTDSVHAYTFCTDASYTGKIYVRGCYFPVAGFFTAFAGTFGQGPI